MLNQLRERGIAYAFYKIDHWLYCPVRTAQRRIAYTHGIETFECTANPQSWRIPSLRNIRLVAGWVRPTALVGLYRPAGTLNGLIATRQRPPLCPLSPTAPALLDAPPDRLSIHTRIFSLALPSFHPQFLASKRSLSSPSHHSSPDGPSANARALGIPHLSNLCTC